MKSKRAAFIAKKLNDTKTWKSHGRGLSMEVLERDLKLKIDNFESNKSLNKLIRSYYRLLKDYMLRRGHEVVIHVPYSYHAM